MKEILIVVGALVVSFATLALIAYDMGRSMGEAVGRHYKR